MFCLDWVFRFCCVFVVVLLLFCCCFVVVLFSFCCGFVLKMNNFVLRRTVLYNGSRLLNIWSRMLCQPFWERTQTLSGGSSLSLESFTELNFRLELLFLPRYLRVALEMLRWLCILQMKGTLQLWEHFWSIQLQKKRFQLLLMKLQAWSLGVEFSKSLIHPLHFTL